VRPAIRRGAGQLVARRLRTKLWLSNQSQLLGPLFQSTVIIGPRPHGEQDECKTAIVSNMSLAMRLQSTGHANRHRKPLLKKYLNRMDTGPLGRSNVLPAARSHFRRQIVAKRPVGLTSRLRLRIAINLHRFRQMS